MNYNLSKILYYAQLALHALYFTHWSNLDFRQNLKPYFMKRTEPHILVAYVTKINSGSLPIDLSSFLATRGAS